jgi:hypothetical protein
MVQIKATTEELSKVPRQNVETQGAASAVAQCAAHHGGELNYRYLCLTLAGPIFQVHNL